MTTPAMPAGQAIGGTANAGSKRGNVMTPEFRVSWPYVFKARAGMKANQEPKFSLTMLFPKGADLSVLQKDVMDCIIEEFGPDRANWPKLRNPFRDQADKAEFGGYEAGAIFITATSKQRPGVVDANVQPIINESEFYAGCYARATVRAFYYEAEGNKGIAFGLQNVQKTRDGEPLTNRTKAEDDFQPIAGAGAPAGAAADIFGKGGNYNPFG